MEIGNNRNAPLRKFFRLRPKDWVGGHLKQPMIVTAVSAVAATEISQRNESYF